MEGKQKRIGDLAFEGRRRRALETLGLERDATPEEITQRYRALARENHPDHHPGDPEKAARFKKIASAYSFLVRGSGTGEGDPAAVEVEDSYARWWWDNFADAY